MTYEIWLKEWLQEEKFSLKTRTYERYCRFVRCQIAPEIGDKELGELTPSVLQGFVATLTERYSANTVKGVVRLLKRSLAKAASQGLTAQNAADDVRCRAGEEKRVEWLTHAEQRRLENYIVKSGKKKLLGFLLCLYTGMRVGELLALLWEDVDFHSRIISVNKSCHDAWDGGVYKKVIEAPKSARSSRLIPIPKQLIPYLRQMREEGSEYVVAGKDGKEISVRSYQNTFAVVLRKLKIRHMGIHSLRHTFATRALECGMDVKTLSELLGHKNSAVTLNVYAHSLMEHKAAMMNRMGKFLT